MARRQAVVKRLTAVETLGSTDIICTDRAGTLTEGRMSVHALWADGGELRPAAGPDEPGGHAGGEPFSALLRTAVRCNNAEAHLEADGWRRAGDPSESALLVAAAEPGEDVESFQADREASREALFRFDSRLKRMTTIDREPDGQLWFHAKGAPAELLERCVAIRGGDGDRPLTPADRSAVAAAVDGYAREGMRVFGRRSSKRSPAASAPGSGSSSSPATTASPPRRSHARRGS